MFLGKSGKNVILLNSLLLDIDIDYNIDIQTIKEKINIILIMMFFREKVTMWSLQIERGCVSLYIYVFRKREKYIIDRLKNNNYWGLTEENVVGKIGIIQSKT